MITRYKASCRQPLTAVASSRANPPGQVSASSSELPQQPSLEGGVNHDNRIFGGHPSLLAAGNERPLASRSCRANCLTCPALIYKDTFVSNSTGRLCVAIDIKFHEVHCKLQNYIYLLTCTACYIQYVGESISPVNLRMNVHRRGKSGCEISINHYKNVCPNATFTIQIIEKLPGNGYRNGAMDQKMLQFRLEREDYWIKKLRTVYPYGLNEKTKFMKEGVPIGRLFPPLPRHGERYINIRKRQKQDINHNNNSTDELFANIIKFSKETRSNELRKILESLKRKHLKILANEAHDKLSICEKNQKRWYEIILDHFYTKVFKPTEPKIKKCPKYIIPIYFDNKGLEYIHLNKILHEPDIIKNLPESLQREEVPSTVYSLSNTIRNKIFNYKKTVENINTVDTVTYGTGIDSCNCANSSFLDDHHGHIITGDLRIIQNNKLRKIISKGPNYREARTINWKKCKANIRIGLENVISGKLSSGNDVSENSLTAWKTSILQRIDEKINILKTKVKPSKTNPILKQPAVINYLETMQKDYVFVPIDKASKNVAIICKKYYVEVLLKEIGIIGNGNKTYSKSEKAHDEIINENMEYTKRLGLKFNEDEKSLPLMYWIPKMHKNPIGARFIIASKTCSTKKISKAVSNVFKLLYTQIENFHKNAKYLKNYNKFWVLQNSEPILQTLKHINKKKNAKSISTYDFSTLYTKLPHDKLLDSLFSIIDFTFNGGNKNFIRLDKNGKAFWGKKVKGSLGFSKPSLKRAVSHLIQNCYFNVGNVVMKQIIGIPMGIDPAPFWANLFLYYYEEKYISSLISTDKVKARHFHATKRFIDDLCALNDGGEFGKSFLSIYPSELELKVEHHGTHATFLNLDISIKDNIFVYKLYDKRDDFNFSIVRMPFADSNIPSSIFYSALKGEFLRIARSTLQLDDFIPKASDLLIRMNKQGARNDITCRSLYKIISNHPKCFQHFSIMTNDLIHLLISGIQTE